MTDTRPLYIFDLDGTLADMRHRLHFIEREPKDWRGFFAACGGDRPIAEGIRTLQTLRRGGAEVWIWTGRSDECKDRTVDWLRRHGCISRWPFGAPVRLCMRVAGDRRPDVAVKSLWLHSMDPPEFDRLAAVFEDRTRVVQMWRAAGVPCFQVADGEF